MSTSIVQRSGTLLKASPPTIRARLIDGRSKRSEDSRLKGSVSMRRNASWALRIALSPIQGVEPCAARPLTCEAHGEHALGLDADVQVGGLAGDGEVRASPPAISASVERSSTSSDSSSGTHTQQHADRPAGGGVRSAHIMAASAPFMS